MQVRLVGSQLENPNNKPVNIQRLEQDYVTLNQTLEELMEEWATLAGD